MKCHLCDKDLNLQGLNSKQKKAVHECTACVLKGITKEELDSLLHPRGNVK